MPLRFERGRCFSRTRALAWSWKPQELRHGPCQWDGEAINFRCGALSLVSRYLIFGQRAVQAIQNEYNIPSKLCFTMAIGSSSSPAPI